MICMNEFTEEFVDSSFNLNRGDKEKEEEEEGEGEMVELESSGS